MPRPWTWPGWCWWGGSTRRWWGGSTPMGGWLGGCPGRTGWCLVAGRGWVQGGGGDVGLVGDVAAVDPTAMRALTDKGLVPVVATVAAGPDGQPYNVNADAAAGSLAAALGAEKLVDRK